GIRAFHVTGVQTCALPISARATVERYAKMRMSDPDSHATIANALLAEEVVVVPRDVSAVLLEHVHDDESRALIAELAPESGALRSGGCRAGSTTGRLHGPP